jgi:hypothetical protein
VDENEQVLKGMPPPLVAVQYYRGSDLYMCAPWDLSCTALLPT